MNLWKRCDGVQHIRRLSSTPWRVVDAQHVNATRKLVDSDHEQELLEQVLDAAKPPAPRGARFDRLHYLLTTPFRYPPLSHGSRFGTRDQRGLWYGSETLSTAFAEVAYYRFYLLAGTAADLPPLNVHLSAFRIPASGNRGVDLTRPPFDAHVRALTSVTSYATTQTLGRAMRDAGVQLVRYTSARDPDRGNNVGLFEPVFSKDAPGVPETWLCTTESTVVDFRAVNIANRRSYCYPRTLFLHKGELPSPSS